MPLSDEKVIKFIEAINQEAQQKKQKLVREIKKHTRQELAKAEEEVLNASYQLIHDKMAEMKNEISRNLSKKQIAARLGLIKIRDDITKKVFAEATEKLMTFVQSEDYAEFLKQSALSIAAAMDGAPCILYVKAEDLSYQDLLLALCPNASLETSGSIHIGGIVAKSAEKRLIADDTLDQRLAEQLPWFHEHSGLTIN